MILVVLPFVANFYKIIERILSAMRLSHLFLILILFVLGTSVSLSQADTVQKYLHVGSKEAYWGTSEDSLGTPPPDFVEYSQEPQIIYKKEHPIIRDDQGSIIEGNALVKLWVGPDGIVKKGIIMRADKTELIQPSLITAMQYQFTPALKNGIPVDVWVACQIKYRKE